MAYTYLGLVNDVCSRFNEVQLTSGNFSTATGVHLAIKEAVNSAISDINQEEFTWPDNWSLETQALTAGTMRYSYPATSKWIDFNTFRIQRDTDWAARLLIQKDYEEYLAAAIDDEYNSSETGIRRMPEIVARAPSRQFVIWPAPDEAYNLDFESYALFTDLSAHDDVPSLGAEFRKVIVDGATMYMYYHRRNMDGADRFEKKFRDGIDSMKSLYSNRYEYVRDTRLPHNKSVLTTLRTY